MIAYPAANKWVAAMARFIVAIVLLAVIAGPVFAQRAKPGDNPLAAVDQQKKKDAAKVDQQYNAIMKNTDKTAAPVRTDPWQDMRGADDSKTKR
jgi:flagellar biosynthesis/type III secretory pathway M-ring protein FliF/YscJ